MLVREAAIITDCFRRGIRVLIYWLARLKLLVICFFMPRKAGIDAAGAFQHIIVRGIASINWPGLPAIAYAQVRRAGLQIYWIRPGRKQTETVLLSGSAALDGPKNKFREWCDWARTESQKLSEMQKLAISIINRSVQNTRIGNMHTLLSRPSEKNVDNNLDTPGQSCKEIRDRSENNS